MKRITIVAVLVAALTSGCATQHVCNPLNGACTIGDEHSGSKTLKWNRVGQFYI
jgi:hypothetical protein